MSKRSFYSLLSVAVVGVLLAILIFPYPCSHTMIPIPMRIPPMTTYTTVRTVMARCGTSIRTDPEGARIEWNVRGVDAADFEISSAGVLTFKESPDFENPTDRGLDLDNDDGFVAR